MAIQADIIGPLKDTLTTARDLFILLPQNAGQEMVNAALGLYQTFKAAGKNVTVACPTPLSATAKNFPGGADITAKIGNRNLIISIQVDKRDSIDKVSYSLDEAAKTFNLVVQPKKGEPPLKKDAVNFTYSGALADAVIMVGANRFEDLGVFYQAEKKLFSEAKTIAVSRFAAVPFADFHVTDNRSLSLAELSLDLINTLELIPPAEAATNLLMGIDVATQNLQSATVTANTFEQVAKLMRLGGVRRLSTPPSVSPPPAAQIQVTPTPTPSPTPTPVPMIKPVTPAPVPQDWLTPKVYKSTDTVSA
ncbi:hypothetical protein A2W24_03240 [Microgenomates group bacterium RBG_16_45_19]|nr:MAG: hypothetical protein A2W24_03240 [Microgenomates group bacterium RBG_16_45_19]